MAGAKEEEAETGCKAGGKEAFFDAASSAAAPTFGGEVGDDRMLPTGGGVNVVTGAAMSKVSKEVCEEVGAVAPGRDPVGLPLLFRLPRDPEGSDCTERVNVHQFFFLPPLFFLPLFLPLFLPSRSGLHSEAPWPVRPQEEHTCL